MRIGSGRLFAAVALLVLFSAAPALAQPPQASSQPASQQTDVSNEDAGIGIGLSLGLTRDTLKTDQAEDFFKTKTGTLFGLWIGGNKNGVVGFTGEFNYLRRKAGGTDSDNDVTLQALEIPAVFHINFGSRSRNGVAGYGVLGPVFTINLKESIKNGVAGDNFNSADVGLMFGAGVEGYRVGLEIRANWGFKSVTNDDGGNFVDAKSRSVEVVGKVRLN
jgi:hypothetical protein